MDLEAIAELFDGIARVSIRRMFGGVGIWSDGVMIGLAADGVLYLKTDEETRPAFASAGSEPFRYQRSGRTTELSYWRLPDAGFDDPDERARYVGLAREAARRAASLKPPGSRRRTPLR